MSSQQYVVTVDDREPEGTVRQMAEYQQILPVLDHMESGDYGLYPHGLTVLIERKTIPDLLSSIASKRLVTQAHRMVEASDRSFLLREGTFRRSPNGVLEYYWPRDPRQVDGWVQSGWNWDAFQGMMFDLQLLGIGLIDCPVAGQYVAEVARIAVNIYKEDHAWLRERERPSILTLDKQFNNAVWGACSFSGVGPEWGEALIRHYGSFSNFVIMVATDPAEVAEVKCGKMKFGMKRATALAIEMRMDWSGSSSSPSITGSELVK